MRIFNRNNRSKKGQAAMEFLMTYGWAILVVLVVIGALAYFGVLTPTAFLPSRCQFSTGLVCLDKQITSDGVIAFRINNGLGTAIDIKAIGVNDSSRFYTGCPAGVDLATPVTILAGQEKTVTITNCAPNDVEVGMRIKASVTLAYSDRTTGFNHTVIGLLLTDVEPSNNP